MNTRRPALVDRVRPDRGSVWLFVFSLILAVFYWTYTVSELKSVKDVSVPVQFANVPQGMMVVGEDARKTVTVEFKGPPDMLKRVREEDVDARIDVSKMQPGPQVVELGQGDVRLPSSVEFERSFPKLIHFALDKKVKDNITLQPNFSGRPAPGMQVLSWTVEPATVQVEGPESVIRKLRHISTQPVSLEGRSATFETPVVATFSDPDLAVASYGPWLLRVVIGERRQQRTIGPIPIKISHGGKYPLTLETPSLRVMVDGPESVVRGLSPEDFVAEVDARGLKPSDKTYQLRPAIRFANPSLESRVDVTGWMDRFVVVRVDKGEPPISGVSGSSAPGGAGGGP